MSRADKAAKFLTDHRFRTAKLKEWLWPMILRMYPNLILVGIRDLEGAVYIMPADDLFITVGYLKALPYDSPLNKALRVLSREAVPLGGTFLDVGANIGTETIKALLSSGFRNAIAIEAADENQRLLASNVTLNALDDRVVLFKNAASDKAGTARIAASPGNCGDFRVTAEDSGEARAVELKTIDQMLLEIDRAPNDVSLVWMDVQGHEGFALRGAASLLALGTPVVFEYSPKMLEEAGCLADLSMLVMENYKHWFDLSDDLLEKKSISTFPDLLKNWDNDREHTDILVI